MNKALQKVVLKGAESYTTRPGETMLDFDFEETERTLLNNHTINLHESDLLSAALYPKVFEEYLNFNEEFGMVSILETPTFFYGMQPHETITVNLEQGKTVNIELTSVSSLKADGTRTIYFNLNGMSQKVEIRDLSVKELAESRPLADRSNDNHIAAQMPGSVYAVKVKEGDTVSKGQVLLITEAMKMETTVQATKSAIVRKVFVKKQDMVKTGELLIELSDID